MTTSTLALVERAHDSLLVGYAAESATARHHAAQIAAQIVVPVAVGVVLVAPGAERVAGGGDRGEAEVGGPGDDHVREPEVGSLGEDATVLVHVASFGGAPLGMSLARWDHHAIPGRAVGLREFVPEIYQEGGSLQVARVAPGGRANFASTLVGPRFMSKILGWLQNGAMAVREPAGGRLNFLPTVTWAGVSMPRSGTGSLR